jgi:hypothetical protein
VNFIPFESITGNNKCSSKADKGNIRLIKRIKETKHEKKEIERTVTPLMVQN